MSDVPSWTHVTAEKRSHTYSPRNHATSPVICVAPAIDTVFDGQATQRAVPVTFLYFPVSHAVQAPAGSPVKPALHVQAALEVLPAIELAPAGQEVHAPDPACEYECSGQTLQA